MQYNMSNLLDVCEQMLCREIQIAEEEMVYGGGNGIRDNISVISFEQDINRLTFYPNRIELI